MEGLPEVHAKCLERLGLIGKIDLKAMNDKMVWDLLSHAEGQ